MAGKAKIRADRVRKINDLEEYPKFKAEITKLETLCRLSKIEKTKEIAQAMKNYIIMRLVAVTENLLKSMTAYFIDEFKISAKNFGGGMTLDLDRLDEIQSKDITKGKIIASTLELANTMKIGTTFGSINKFHRNSNNYEQEAKRFFTWIQELSPAKKGERDFFKELDELLKKRNAVAHEMDDYLGVVTAKKITDWHGLLMMMWYASYLHLSRNRKEMKQFNALECKNKFKMDIEKFNKITRKYSDA